MLLPTIPMTFEGPDGETFDGLLELPDTPSVRPIPVRVRLTREEFDRYRELGAPVPGDVGAYRY
jgi:hypothetical protein